MMLGDLLAQFEDEAVAAETVLRIADLATVAALRAQADARGVTLGAFASAAARGYAEAASDDEWITLIGAMGRADDPGAVFLSRAFSHALQKRDAAPGVRPDVARAETINPG